MKPNITGNTGRKENYLRDIAKIKDVQKGGCYAFMPFNKLDESGKAAFKVGMATNILNRFEQHYTDFPNSVYTVAILSNPPIPRKLRSQESFTAKQYYEKIEKYIFDDLVKTGAIRLRSLVRINNANKDGGLTEWFYTDDKTIQRSFLKAEEKFGGNFYGEYLTKGKFSINTAGKNFENSSRPHYNGTVTYFV